VPNAADVRQSAVPHETLSGRVSPFSPNHPIMITKGNNIAGEVACLRMLLGARGSPLRLASQEQSSASPLPTARRSLSYLQRGRCYQYIILKPRSKRAEWYTNTYRQAVNTPRHQSPPAAPPYPYHDAPVRWGGPGKITLRLAT
jgi:hypothetical protein